MLFKGNYWELLYDLSSSGTGQKNLEPFLSGAFDRIQKHLEEKAGIKKGEFVHALLGLPLPPFATPSIEEVLVEPYCANKNVTAAALKAGGKKFFKDEYEKRKDDTAERAGIAVRRNGGYLNLKNGSGQTGRSADRDSVADFWSTYQSFVDNITENCREVLIYPDGSLFLLSTKS
ncbi:hypothetical protein AGMMS49949_01820 [Alphaproteobacteria bacterium]|nr:hypothetical protein AGMMS49949_01820 [Alphaproteobacteria bacterium]GHS97566.1 hypothetical protein AGMMS50296_4650 [Alphaproteobacteria bacterium]